MSLEGMVIGLALLAVAALWIVAPLVGRNARQESVVNNERGELLARYDRLLRNIREFPQHGCCVSVGELYPDVVAVAVPLGPIDHGERAALNCSFQRREADRQWLLKEAGPRLQALAAALRS